MRLTQLTASLVLLGACAFASPSLGASSWWQFASVNADGSRQVHSPFKDEATCQAALKKLEAEMKKKFPDQFPLVGSCEEYQSEK
jgi:predicted DNA-binding WGR domain protein